MYSLKQQTSPRNTTTTTTTKVHPTSSSSNKTYPSVISPRFSNNNNRQVVSTFQQQLANIDTSSASAQIPWQRVNHTNIPPWEQDRLLKEVLTAMLFRDVVDNNNNNNNNTNNNNNEGASFSLHRKVTEAATEVMSNFVRSAILGAAEEANNCGNSILQHQQQQKSTSVSLGAIRIPSASRRQQQVNNNNNNDDQNEKEEEESATWTRNIQDRRQTQMERLLSDAQGEVVVLRQQLEDITKAHDDSQRALNQAYHEYDALQRHVLELNNNNNNSKNSPNSNAGNSNNNNVAPKRPILGAKRNSPPNSNTTNTTVTTQDESISDPK